MENFTINDEITEIICIIDSSGSMYTIKNSSIEGFNSFLKSQKALPGKANMTLVYFNHEVKQVFKSKDIQAVEELTDTTYNPQGNTALFDAIGKTVTEISIDIDNKAIKADRVLCVILTDGEENASTEFRSRESIKQLIEVQRTKSWEFIFLAANQDAFSGATSLGISKGNAMNFAANDLDNSKTYSKMSAASVKYRSASRGFSGDLSYGTLMDEVEEEEKNK